MYDDLHCCDYYSVPVDYDYHEVAWGQTSICIDKEVSYKDKFQTENINKITESFPLNSGWGSL